MPHNCLKSEALPSCRPALELYCTFNRPQKERPA